MYSQASQLLESKEAVLRAPSNNQKAYVIRNDGGGKPHYAYQEESGKVVCEECPRFNSAKICCHALVVAEKCGGLSNFFPGSSAARKSSQLPALSQAIVQRLLARKGIRPSHLQHGEKGKDRRPKPVK